MFRQRPNVRHGNRAVQHLGATMVLLIGSRDEVGEARIGDCRLHKLTHVKSLEPVSPSESIIR
jgi:hypothetical protein